MTISKKYSPEQFGKVAVLMGGWSSERDVSLESGKAVLGALVEYGVDAHKIDVKRDTILDELKNNNYDRVFNILHGPGGEDGVIQGALEILGIPYTGSGVLGSAIAMDKLRCKELLQGSGLPTPTYMRIDADTDFEYLAATLGLPIMIKPALEGSSIGMSKVDSVEDIEPAYLKAVKFCGDVLAEQWVDGKEYTVAILGKTPLPVICLETKRDFYDFDAKYVDDDTTYLCPCGLANDEEAQLQRLALAAYNAAGIEDWGRVDIMTDADGKPWILEINTIPGMTSHSLVPMAAKQSGMTFQELVIEILASSMEESV